MALYIIYSLYLNVWSKNRKYLDNKLAENEYTCPFFPEHPWNRLDTVASTDLTVHKSLVFQIGIM
jgi:hypothetical protein